MKQYDHKKIEQKWQEFWDQNKIYTTPDTAPGKDNFYLLVEFPYPSGNLHVGHWYAFSVPDMYARMLRMQGRNVMYPIGFDAFGLPAENAAIKNKLNPRTWTYGNIEYMKKQIRSMGTSFDWSREVITCDPGYYKWTQWLFLQLYKNGLVYQKETAVNWCPKDKTVLANEQVVDGKCERCDTPVEQRMMLQWNIKITEYADRLIDDLDGLDWPEQIKESQRNWIGRSEGAEIDFPLDIEVEKKRLKFLILHGYTGRNDHNFIPAVKTALESEGHLVEAPLLPHTDNPEEEEQVSAALQALDFDEDTVLVGHSLGAIVAMKALLRSGKKISRLVLIAPAMPAQKDTASKPFHHTFDWTFDWDNIKGLTRDRVIISDVQETHRVDYLRDMAKKLDARLFESKANRKHYTAVNEPDILMWLLPTIRVFTTRPDTLFGATYLVLAPEHPWVTLALSHPDRTGKTVLKNNDEVEAYVKQAGRKSELERMTDQKDKTGVKLEGVDAVNPATGEKIPLYVADYVLANYGTGAIMAVPAHDERDYEFAKKFGLPIQEVVEPMFTRWTGIDGIKEDQPFVRKEAVDCIVRNPKDDKYLVLKWKNLPWITLVTGGIDAGEDAESAARREIHEETGYKNIRLVKKLGGVHARFYHVNKNSNTWAHGHGMYFELIDDEHEQISKDEAAIHDIFWLGKEAVEKQFTAPDMVELWNRLHNVPRPYIGEGILINSNGFDGMTTQEARAAITEKYGRVKKTYRLRDWIVSRQRYWGVPIPIIHCEKCGANPVPDEQLPVLLPDVEDYLPTGDGKSPLAKVDAFVHTQCPVCGGAARRETDTLDTFVDSSWYFLRYTDPKNTAEFAARDRQDAWMPVDLYSGGAEHTTMHLLYSRFWHKALYDRGLVADPEPYKRRMNRSLILGPDGQKMSKSRGNVIDPDEVVARLGADTVRMYLAFIGPYNEVANYPWNPDGVVGVRRFLERVSRAEDLVKDDDVAALNAPLHKVIKKVGDDTALLKFNTAISQLMILLNAIEKEKQVGRAQWEVFIKLLAPFAPHLAEELWSSAGKTSSVHGETWPAFDERHLKEDTVTIAIQIDGKTRGEVRISSDADKAAMEAAAREAVAARLEGQEITRVVVVPGRLVNFVLKHPQA